MVKARVLPVPVFACQIKQQQRHNTATGGSPGLASSPHKAVLAMCSSEYAGPRLGNHVGAAKTLWDGGRLHYGAELVAQHLGQRPAKHGDAISIATGR
jgi:hypothetical protein